MAKNAKIFLALGLLFLIIVIVAISSKWSRERVEGDSFGMMTNEIARESTDMSLGMKGEPMMMKTLDSAVPNPEVKQADRLIIKTGSLSLLVKDVKQSVDSIVKYVTDNGGFVVYSNIYKSGLSPAGEVTVRVPAKVFDSSVGEIKKLGEIQSESVNGQDVTEEYVDLEAQLKNLRASESQFLQIMTKAQKIEDVLAVQRELTVVRGQIEGIQGQIKYLSQSAEMSILTIYLSTDPNALPTLDQENKWKPWAEVKTAVRSLLEFGKGLVALVIWLVIFVPLWLFIVLVVWLVHRWWKRRNNG